MFRNYFKTAWRNLLKNRIFSTINLIGLTIGMTAVMLIWFWVQNELSYDRFYSNSEDLYKLYNKNTDGGNVNVWDVTSGPAAKELKDNYPEVKDAARIYWPIERLLTYGDVRIKSIGNDVDSPFLSMFDFPLVAGNRKNLLSDENSIVLTESLAKKLFGKDNPINKVITVDEHELFKVTGVIKDLPSNTAFDFNYLVPLTKAGEYSNTWSSNSYYTYVQLQSRASADIFNEKIANLLNKHTGDTKTSLFLYPVSETHLYSRFENGRPVGGKIEEVRLVVFIGILILLIACINFMNLSTARSQKRAKEVGVRKVIGGSKGSLVMQFLAESVLLSLAAGILALVIVKLALPLFNTVMGKNFVFNFSNPVFWLALLAFIVLTGLLAGLYPALFLSAFKPARVLKATINEGNKTVNLRKILVVLQFSLAIILIVSTLIIHKQIDFVQQRNIGYNVSGLVEVPVEGNLGKSYESLKAALLNSGAVNSVARTGWGVTVDGSNGSGFSWSEASPDQEKTAFSFARTESDFIKTLNLQLLAGRDIDYARFPADSNAVLVNARAVKVMGLKDPIGKYITRGDAQYVVRGVFNDFIVGSPYNETAPMIVFASKNWLLNLVIRFDSNKNMQQNLQVAEKVFKRYNPAYPFTYRFVDEEYAQKFKDQQQTATLAGLFSALAIFISCLGLLGLASYMAETRIKEIGIRKVFGASALNIAQLFSREFVILIIIAALIATPVTWWFMSNWLEDFSYRTSIKWWYFLYAGGGALLLALITVSFQSIKTALSNPVKSLRSE